MNLQKAVFVGAPKVALARVTLEVPVVDKLLIDFGDGTFY